jgi:PST family polysaccharide transporter
MIKKFIQSKDNKRLITNFLSLSVLQGANMLLPLITFPYLVRVLGIEKFGLISFAAATVMYFETLTDYGFDLTATRQISIHRNDREKVESIYSSVLTIKALLAVLSFIILSIIVFTFQKFSEFFIIYYLTFGRVIGKSLFPVWFFQGMEKMVITTYLNLFSKILFTVAIFVFIRNEQDFLLVPLFNSLGFIIAGIIAMFQIRFGFGIRLAFQSREIIIDQLKDGWHIFLSRIYVNIYTTTNTFLLGILTSNIMVGYYSVASKIVEAIGNIFIPANNALFPYMSKLFHESTRKFYRLVTRVSWVYLAVAFCLMAGGFIFGKPIIGFVNGTFNDEIYLIYIILLITLLLAPYGSFFTMIWVNQGRKEQYLQVVKYTFIANIILVPISIYFYSVTGLAVTVLLINIFHVMLFLRFKINPGVNTI